MSIKLVKRRQEGFSTTNQYVQVIDSRSRIGIDGTSVRAVDMHLKGTDIPEHYEYQKCRRGKFSYSSFSFS
jgi:hypothetical protein